MTMGSESPPPSRPSARRTRSAIAVVLVGLTLVVVAASFFFVRAVRLGKAESLAENDAIARGVAGYIQAREEGYLNVLQAYAGRFRFREAVKRQDRAEALVHLRQLRESFPELDRPLLADPSGVVWAIYPESPEVYGKSFAWRDWYQGVSREWRPYMSEVFQAVTADRALLVALAVPIRDLGGTVIGIIVSAQRLDVIRQWLLPIRVPAGDLYVVDRRGQLVFHRTRMGPERATDYARVPAVERLLRGDEGVAETENPVDGEVNLTAYRRLPFLGWGLVVHRSKNAALERTRTLMVVSAGAGLLLTAALAVLATVALRNQRETASAFAALEGKTQALRDSEMRFRALTESAVDGVISADGDGNVVSWNKGAEAIFGYGEDEVLGRPLTLLMPERYRDAHRRGLARIRATGETHVIGKTVELHGLRRDGGEFPLELSLAAWKVADRAFYSGIVRDVTERKRAEEALRDAQEELARKERLAILGQLAGGVSHELRNPLGVIKNAVYYLKLVLPEDERARKHLRILEREVATANRITTALLDFARARPPSRVPTELSGLVRGLLEGTFFPDSVTLVADLAADLPRVPVDPGQVEQVLVNLVTNAIQAMPEGGTLTVETARADGGASVAVSDAGVGIPASDLEKIFQPLFTTKAKGIGLGLAVAKGLVEANGGTIAVESAPGRGSRFVVRFPGPAEEG